MLRALAFLAIALRAQSGTDMPVGVGDIELERETGGFLRWYGSGDCQPDADFREQLVQLTEETRETHTRQGLALPQLRVRLQANGQRPRTRYAAVITSDSPIHGHDQWQIDPGSCALLHADIFEALVALLPRARARVRVQKRPDEPPRQDDKQHPDTSGKNRPRPLRARSHGLRLGVDAGSQLGPFPKPSVSLGLVTELGVARFVFESRLRFSAVRPDVADPSQGPAVDHYQQYLGQVSPCIVATEGLRLRLPVCVGVELGFVRATMSAGWNNRRPSTGFWGAVTVGARLQLRANPQSTAIALGLEAWITKPGALRWRNPEDHDEPLQAPWRQNSWIGGRGFIELSLRAHAWTRLRKFRRRTDREAG